MSTRRLHRPGVRVVCSRVYTRRQRDRQSEPASGSRSRCTRRREASARIRIGRRAYRASVGGVRQVPVLRCWYVRRIGRGERQRQAVLHGQSGRAGREGLARLEPGATAASSCQWPAAAHAARRRAGRSSPITASSCAAGSPTARASSSRTPSRTSSSWLRPATRRVRRGFYFLSFDVARWLDGLDIAGAPARATAACASTRNTTARCSIIRRQRGVLARAVP